MIETQKIDKTSWGPGPWQEEHDRVEFTHEGFKCLLNRTSMGNWCGYVAVPRSHPFFAVTESQCSRRTFKQHVFGPCKISYCEHSPGSRLKVHGGITWSDYAEDGNHEDDPDHWLFGFDCAHGFDFIPGLYATMERVMGPPPQWVGKDHYWTEEEVIKEVQSLALQLSLIE